MASVPVVDLQAPSATSRAALDEACRDHGFFLVSGHGLDDLIARTWAETERFFDTPREHRLTIERDEQNPLGYFDRELTKRKRDHKQVFDFVDPTVPTKDAHNRWPEGPEEFRSTLVEFFDGFAGLADQCLGLLHDVLELSAEGRSAMVHDRAGSSVRLNHYPVGDPVPEGEREGLVELGDVALGHHTDPGVLTMLLQDDTGGLQARSLDGGWIDIEPVPGTVVVNLADAVQVWTNDRYRAAVHRVLPMTERRRFSIPYFSNPPRHTMVEPLAELLEGDAAYRRFDWTEFSRARADDNYADLGAADSQISDYRVA